jgi:hypothetical protein
MADSTSHDQNFKNQILDYPLQAVAFYASEQAQALDQKPRIVPVRQEQLKKRLGDRFRELDTPLLLEWPNGERAAILFLFEEESQSSRFSIHRLAHYCLDVAELHGTRRVVPVTIFLNAAPNADTELQLGAGRVTYLGFHYIQCVLGQLEAQDYFDSDNIIARMNLPLMRYSKTQKLEVFHHAIQGLITLEENPDQQAKYADWVDIYARLDDNEIKEYAARYPQEEQVMASFADRYRQEGEARGEARGEAIGKIKGEAQTLFKQIQLKFGDQPEWVEAKLNTADRSQLDRWVAAILTASSLDELFGE